MGFIEYLTDPFTQSTLLEQGLEHLVLTLVPIVVATVLGVALGILAHRWSSLRPAIMNTTSTMLTIPSLALFALLIGIVGIGDLGPIIALTMYALLPITRNTLSGLESVDQAVVESARGMGMSTRQRLVRIELPNAWPVILTGIRVATQMAVGIASIAALIGGGGLGNEILNQGINRIGSPGALYAILGGTLTILVLAMVLDGMFQLIGRATTSKGLA